MALNKTTLRNDLVAMMKSAKDHSWSEEQVASAMADAVDRYTRGAEVVGVTVKRDNLTLEQTGKGRVQ